MSRLSLMQRFLLMGSAIAVILTILLVIAFSGLSNIGDASDSISQR